jgi:hypothetical protein
MLGDRTEHPEPSETMPMPGASVRTRGSRGTLAPPLHWGRVAMDARGPRVMAVGAVAIGRN